MFNPSAIPVSRKLPAVIVGLCLCASFSIAIVSYSDFRANILEEARRDLRLTADNRSAALQTWSETVEDSVRGLAQDPTLTAALNSFTTSFNLMIDRRGLQAAYITDNPHAVDQRELLDQAPESVPYHFQHGQFHPYFRKVKDTDGYYDLLLLNPDGDVLYSVAKAEDYATNMLTGRFRTSGLAQAFEAARDGIAGAVYFADFSVYAPSGDPASAFLSTPILDANENLLGVVAVRLPNSQINAIVNNPRGLGDTGEVYLVGPDRMTRSESRFDGGHSLLSDLSGLLQVESVLGEQGEFIPDAVGLSGVEVLAKGQQVQVFGQEWGILSEVARSQVEAPALAMRNKMALTSLVVAALSTLLGWLIARSFVLPLSRVGAAMGGLADKNYNIDLAEEKRGDEIGHIAQTVVALSARLRASDKAEEERRILQAQQAQIVGRVGQALSELAEGDLTHTINTPFEGEYDTLRQNFNRTVATLNATLGTVVGRAGDIRQRASTMSADSDDLSRRTENQAATLEQTAAALDELTTSVKAAADGARKVESVVNDARKDAEES